MAEILLRRTADGSWTWSYRAEDGPEIFANRVFPTRDEAAVSAGLAYPGVAVRSERRRGRAVRGRWLVVAGAGVVLAIALRSGRRRLRVRPVSAGPAG